MGLGNWRHEDPHKSSIQGCDLPPFAELMGQEGKSQEAMGKLDAGKQLKWRLGLKCNLLISCDIWNGSMSHL